MAVQRDIRPLVAVADLSGRRALRSASTSHLLVPPIKQGRSDGGYIGIYTPPQKKKKSVYLTNYKLSNFSFC